MCSRAALILLGLFAPTGCTRADDARPPRAPEPLVGQPTRVDPAAAYNFDVTGGPVGTFDPVVGDAAKEVGKRLRAGLTDAVGAVGLYVRPSTKDAWLGELGSITARYEVESRRYRHQSSQIGVPIRVTLTIEVTSLRGSSTWDGRRELVAQLDAPPENLDARDVLATKERFARLLAEDLVKQLGAFRRQ